MDVIDENARVCREARMAWADAARAARQEPVGSPEWRRLDALTARAWGAWARVADASEARRRAAVLAEWRPIR